MARTHPQAIKSEPAGLEPSPVPTSHVRVVYVSVCICVSVHVFECVFACKCVSVHVCVHLNVCVCMYECKYVYTVYVNVYVCVYVYVCLFMLVISRAPHKSNNAVVRVGHCCPGHAFSLMF